MCVRLLGRKRKYQAVGSRNMKHQRKHGYRHWASRPPPAHPSPSRRCCSRRRASSARAATTTRSPSAWTLRCCSRHAVGKGRRVRSLRGAGCTCCSRHLGSARFTQPASLQRHPLSLLEQVLRSAVGHDADALEMKLAMRSLPCTTGEAGLLDAAGGSVGTHDGCLQMFAESTVAQLLCQALSLMCA